MLTTKHLDSKSFRVQARVILSVLFFVFAEILYVEPLFAERDSLDYMLEDYVVVGKRINNYIKSKDVGEIAIDKKLIEIMPQVMGNADPMRMMQMMPGVSVNSEYDAGLHVEGGENSHSAILLDGVRIYNPNHFLGLFSVFNPGHYTDITLHKNTFVQTSSDVIGAEMNMESVNSKRETVHRFGGELSVGPMNSQGTLAYNGKRTMLRLSARQAYLNLFYKNLLKFDDSEFNYTFGDYNGTLSIDLTPRNRLSLIGYWGRDKATLVMDDNNNDIYVKWKNYMAQARLETQGERAKTTNSLHLSHYDNFFSYREDKLYAVLPSSIEDYGYTFDYNRKRFRLNASFSYYDVLPQSPDVIEGKNIETEGTDRETAVLGSLHAYNTFLLPLNIKLRTHLRLSLYHSEEKLFPSFDPSISLQREFGAESKAPSSLTICIGQQHQHLFQTGFSNMGLPTEFWMTASPNREPQRMRGVSLDFEQRYMNNEYKLTLSGYYRRLANQIEYSGDMMSLITDKYILDNQLLWGKGMNYGANIMIQRVKGNLVGWVSYGYSRSLREYSGDKEDWMVGKYPSCQDRPHQLNVVLTYKSKKDKWDAGASYVFASGKPYTSPRSIFVLDGKLLTTYGEYNASRLPSYMRLDVSGNYYFKKTDRQTIGLNLSFYNVTMRKNVLMYRVRKSVVNPDDYIYSGLSFLVRMMPSLSFFIKF